MNQVCRCCLLENPIVAFNIFQENLRAELLLCVPSVNIEQNDGLPEIICDQCWLRLHEAIEFRRRCEENDRELRKRYDETSHAIDQALGLCVLEQFGDVRDQQANLAPNATEEEFLSSGDGGGITLNGVITDDHLATKSDISVGQLLEEYSALEMTMLDELMMQEGSFSSLSDGNGIDGCNHKDDEDAIIKELLAKFLNDPVVESVATDSAPNPPTSLEKISGHKIIYHPANELQPQPQLQLAPTSCQNKSEKNTAEKKTKKPSTKSAHPCPQCDKKFTRNFQLKLHMISVHGVGDGLQYTCPECSKTFASRHSLNYHQKALHSMERPFACTFCARSFVLRTQLASHIRIHTGEVKPRIYPCPECEKTWPTKSDLKTHLRSHDPHLDRPFKCTRCTKSFFTQGHLNSHELVHTGEKPYPCTFCEKAYQNVGNLNNHIFRSHGQVLTGDSMDPAR